MRRFEDLEVWKRSSRLCVSVYKDPFLNLLIGAGRVGWFEQRYAARFGIAENDTLGQQRMAEQQAFYPLGIDVATEA